MTRIPFLSSSSPKASPHQGFWLIWLCPKYAEGRDGLARAAGLCANQRVQLIIEEGRIGITQWQHHQLHSLLDWNLNAPPGTHWVISGRVPTKSFRLSGKWTDLLPAARKGIHEQLTISNIEAGQ